jgi:hypothetical protein
MITPLSVQDALDKFLKEEVAHQIILSSYDIENKTTKLKNPQIVSGWIIPQKSNNPNKDDTEYPYIATRILSVKDIENAGPNKFSEVTIKIMFGAYSKGTYKDDVLIKDSNGYRDVLNMMEKTRQMLFKQKMLENKYMINRPFEAFAPEEQAYPYWECHAITKWAVNLPYSEID